MAAGKKFAEYLFSADTAADAGSGLSPRPQSGWRPWRPNRNRLGVATPGVPRAGIFEGSFVMNRVPYLKLVEQRPPRARRKLAVRIAARSGHEPHGQTRLFRLDDHALDELIAHADRLERRTTGA
jgi:hypothetical protein